MSFKALEKLLRERLLLFQKAGDHGASAIIALRLARLVSARGEAIAARNLLNRALEQLNEGDTHLRAKLLLGLGEVGELPRHHAVRCFELAGRLWANNPQGLVAVCMASAALAANHDDHEGALAQWSAARRHLVRCSPSEDVEFQISEGTALSHAALGNRMGAEACLSPWLQAQNAEFRGRAAFLLSMTAFESGKFERAASIAAEHAHTVPAPLDAELWLLTFNARLAAGIPLTDRELGRVEKTLSSRQDRARSNRLLAIKAHTAIVRGQKDQARAQLQLLEAWAGEEELKLVLTLRQELDALQD